jgi:hypothetical protein
VSDVIIRCPNCGTTQVALGECEACHEADTRYFCTNHVPGLWLDGPVCSTCGARYGVARETRRPPPPPRARVEPPVRPRSRPPPPEEPEPVPVDVWLDPVPTPRRGDIREIDTGAIETRGIEPRGGWSIEPPFSPDSVRLATVAGCARRLVLLIVILLALAALALFGLLSGGSSFLFSATNVVPVSPVSNRADAQDRVRSRRPPSDTRTSTRWQRARSTRTPAG